MAIRTGHEFEAKRPTGKPLMRMRQSAGCRRFVHDKAIAWQTGRLADKGNPLTYAGLFRLPVNREKEPDTAWPAEAPSPCEKPQAPANGPFPQA
jgi:hypothetical protein